MNKKQLSERDICTKFITPALKQAGWNTQTQIREDSAWRRILEYYGNATHIGLTATPKETEEVSNIEYFGDPIYTYSLKQGINDGFLAPYRVVRIGLNVDLEGWRPPAGYLDKNGNPVEDRIYNRTDFDKNLIVEERRKLVAEKVSEFLKGTDRFAKTIMFCVDIEHAEATRREMVNANGDLAKDNAKYIMRITGDNDEGKRELDIFDIICHVAFDQPPLTRKERAENVKKRNYFTKYAEAARAVLEALLDKYAEHGVEDLESMEVLKVQPFDRFGSPTEIVKVFGSKAAYLAAIRELEQAIYKEAA
jgi:type I restriction enzyme R subunit